MPDMPQGCDLDVALAKRFGYRTGKHRFLGWCLIDKSGEPAKPSDGVYEYGYDEAMAWTVYAPNYSSSMVAMLELIHEMRARGWRIQCDNFADDWTVEFHWPHVRVHATAPSLPNAVARAAWEALCVMQWDERETDNAPLPAPTVAGEQAD